MSQLKKLKNTKIIYFLKVEDKISQLKKIRELNSKI